MFAEFKETTRGSEKVFVRVTLAEGADVSALHATAQAQTGSPVPVMLVDDGVPNEGVLVIPQFDVDVIVTLRNGSQITSLAINPKRAKRQSQLNTLIKNADAERVRNIDAKVRRSSGRINPTDVVPDWPTSQIIVRGVAETLVPSGDPAAAGKVDFLVLGKDGMPYSGAGSTVLGTIVDNPVDGVTHRCVGFSFRLPLEPPTVIVWARGLMATDGDVFVILTGDDLRHRRDDFAGMTCPSMSDIFYNEWFRLHCATREELELQRVHRFALEPTFSIVVPLFRTPIEFFEEMAASVLSQTYSKLQLVLVNASPEDARLAQAVDELAAADNRVSVVRLDGNRGITENTNAGIEASTGDFVCFLDHDDTLEPNLLFEYAKGINDYPTTDLLYCDEDKLENGKYTSGFFKPDWDPEFMCSLNYVTHLLTVRKAVIETLEPATSDYDGAQDHNLTLRAGEVARNVYHVRKPLYHWRISANSTAADPETKPYTVVAGIRSVQEHLDRIGVSGRVVRCPETNNGYQVEYNLVKKPLVSIIIPSKDHVPVLERCLNSIRERTTYTNYEVIVVENNSTDPSTFAYYDHVQAEDDRVNVITCRTDGAFNYSRLNNFGVSHARGDYLLLLNNDTEIITTDWIERLLGPCTFPGVGVTGAKLLYPDDIIQHAGIEFHRDGPGAIGSPLPRDSFDYNCYYRFMRDTTAVTGACLLTSKALWEDLGGMDESFAVNYNDVDFCLRVWQRGYRVVYQPTAELYHYESVTRGIRKSPAQDRQWKMEEGLLKVRYPRYYVEGDPLQNPNTEGPYHHIHW